MRKNNSKLAGILLLMMAAIALSAMLRPGQPDPISKDPIPVSTKPISVETSEACPLDDQSCPDRVLFGGGPAPTEAQLAAAKASYEANTKGK
jgi:hypothetical protein